MYRVVFMWLYMYIYWIMIDICSVFLIKYLLKNFRIVSLYNWRYKKLGSFFYVMVYFEYKKVNVGFVFDY